jgi:thiol-disulfide isomerase/thioredoxin
MAVSRVEYDFRAFGTGDFATAPVFTGTVRLIKESDTTPYRMWVHFNADTLETGEFLPDLTLSTDGVTAWSLDLAQKSFMTGLLSAGGGDLLQASSFAAMAEYAIPDPFLAEIEADSVAYEGVDTVAGVPCDVVYVIYQGGAADARWWFGQEDRLPRKVERGGIGAAQGTQVIELTRLVPEAAFDEASFVLSPPDSSFTVSTYSAILQAGVPAPEWTLYTPDGQTLSLGSLLGKVVVLDFWATWCDPCARAMPGMQSLYQEFSAESLQVVGVNVWEDEGSDPAGFAASNGITYPIVVGGDSVATEYLVTAIPTFYVIDRQGLVVWAGRGFDPQTELDLRAAVETALGAD